MYTQEMLRETAQRLLETGIFDFVNTRYLGYIGGAMHRRVLEVGDASTFVYDGGFFITYWPTMEEDPTPWYVMVHGGGGEMPVEGELLPPPGCC